MEMRNDIKKNFRGRVPLFQFLMQIIDKIKGTQMSKRQICLIFGSYEVNFSATL